VATGPAQEHTLDYFVAEEFHVYGLEWDADQVVFYVDGKSVDGHFTFNIGLVTVNGLWSRCGR
jgi:hypothetical protein